MTIQVKLLDHTDDPVKALYIAYRTAYSSLTPMQIDKRIADGRIRVSEWRTSSTGHSSPFERVWFEYGIAGVSRSFSHQFVRRRKWLLPGDRWIYVIVEFGELSHRLGPLKYVAGVIERDE